MVINFRIENFLDCQTFDRQKIQMIFPSHSDLKITKKYEAMKLNLDNSIWKYCVRFWRFDNVCSKRCFRIIITNWFSSFIKILLQTWSFQSSICFWSLQTQNYSIQFILKNKSTKSIYPRKSKNYIYSKIFS
jgi:hypothetical protein